MAYACPVCSAPQADGEHLADHLALSAVLHGGDHEAWLDEHVPDWEGSSPGAMASAVVDLAAETDHELDVDGTVEPTRRVPDRPADGRELDPAVRRAVEDALAMERGHDGEE